MRIARVVSVGTVDRVDESWLTLPDPGDFGRVCEKSGSRGRLGYVEPDWFYERPSVRFPRGTPAAP